MILRNLLGESYKLKNKVTLKEFINDVIEKDEEREIKFYEVHLEKEIQMKNMILYYQNGKLKSHHTTFRKFNYLDHLNDFIKISYESGYIKGGNIYSFSKDYEVDKKPKIKDKSIDEIIEEMIEERRKNDLISDARFRLKKLSNEEMREVISILIEKVDDNRSDLSSLKSELNRQETINYCLSESIKWLEYKMKLSITNNNSKIKKKSIGIKYMNKYKK
ncbi:hypothetical protein NE398_19530 [Clostridium tertium]|uniref:Uncharacterized protein n=1 Tax=Clostridium tertium TaxID=1559 RepID=A0A9X3XP35_9CLOT|nr:hypothetical protein [Clostridium tertium]MDC4242326.1 hypothetical protein [Clostridium tertium]